MGIISGTGPESSIRNSHGRMLDGESASARKRVLAIASGGGHWVQLLRLAAAFDGCDVAYVTVNEGYREQVRGSRFYAVNDATRWNRFGLVLLAIRLAYIVLLRERPDVIISTGAAPGYFGLLIGRWIGCRTVWVDSIANAEKLSLSGEKIGRFADLWLTQWPHLAKPKGPLYAGAVL
jgi:UDP-N-acetylglucosamine:LPS N-acetylglucosamine transferase